VPRPGPGAGGGAAQPPPDAGGPAGGASASPSRPEGRRGDGEPTDEELQEVARQLAAAPPEDVVANHCYGLFELAALHLSQQPPKLPQASLAIDAMALLVEGLGERLGGRLGDLVEGLAQLRLAFVRISDTVPPSGRGPDGG
jgi:hypothetical protein